MHLSMWNRQELDGLASGACLTDIVLVRHSPAFPTVPILLSPGSRRLKLWCIFRGHLGCNHGQLD